MSEGRMVLIVTPRGSLRPVRKAFKKNHLNYLLSKVEHEIQKRDTVMRFALEPKLKLHIALYFLNTGNSYRSLSHFLGFRISKSSICSMLPHVCEAIYHVLMDFIKVPATNEDWNKIEAGFRRKWNFPRCGGALDGKHVVIKAPAVSGSYYYNYKHTNSIVLMALVDDNYCFSYIDVGCNGRISDGGVFRNCNLSAALENNLLPDGHVIVGDNAFPLKPYLMKPYPGSNLTLKQKIFNYRLSRARRIVENAFGILVARFRVFERPIPISPDKVDKVVKACCALHNWLCKTKSNVNAPTVDIEDTHSGRIIPGDWRDVPSDGLQNLPTNSHNHSPREARRIRDDYADYFVGEGSVDWQIRMIS
ncbi:putative nuclease HARBI1 [Leguminivora glycinivorella]|uniref:putative nuclease HARBI1 n=1 Tax=Leguminivora glycinivorella TaxID=1035111 RepID=UPI0020103799|nr:putative nuclease HARBI1 [Leguminivora glycinivorella]